MASVPEAQLADFGSGLTPVTGSSSTCGTPSGGSRREGGARCAFENEYGDPPVEFAQFGINVTVLEPGQTGLYHAESNQEAFLVLSGECGLLVEDEERRLRPWDFFHSSPWTEHAFVGAGEGPCVILMVGSRRGPGVHYPASELAARYGASVAEETPTGGRRTRRSSGSGASDRRTGLDCPGRRSPGRHSRTLAQVRLPALDVADAGWSCSRNVRPAGVPSAPNMTRGPAVRLTASTIVTFRGDPRLRRDR